MNIAFMLSHIVLKRFVATNLVVASALACQKSGGARE